MTEVNVLKISKFSQKQKVYLENPSIPGVGIIKDEIYGREAELTFVGERSVEETFEVIKERIQEELNK